MWGQVVVALRDDDTIRRPLAPIRSRMRHRPSIDGGETPALRDIGCKARTSKEPSGLEDGSQFSGQGATSPQKKCAALA